MNPSQDSIGNSVHESNNSGFINNNPSCDCNNNSFYVMNNDLSCNRNNNDFSVINNDTFPVHTSISPSYNNYHQRFMTNSISNNNNILSNHNYQQSMPNNVSPPQFYPQYIDQNSPQPSVPLLNSLGITINSPHIN